MAIPILKTKLFIPTPPKGGVARSRLLERLDTGLDLGHRLILVSAPAGFGKTTVLADWIAQRDYPVAWVSLDEGDNDLARFLTYLVAALQRIESSLGEDIASILEAHQPPPVESSLTRLLNQVASLSRFTLIVLDDYHVITSQPIHQAVAFFLENLPPNATFLSPLVPTPPSL